MLSQAPARHAAPAPVAEYISAAPAVGHGAPTPTGHAAPAPAVEYIAPASAVSYGAPASGLAGYTAPAPVVGYHQR